MGRKRDFDGDSFSNLQELLDGTDPNNSFSQGQFVVNLSPSAMSYRKWLATC